MLWQLLVKLELMWWWISLVAGGHGVDRDATKDRCLHEAFAAMSTNHVRPRRSVVRRVKFRHPPKKVPGVGAMTCA